MNNNEKDDFILEGSQNAFNEQIFQMTSSPNNNYSYNNQINQNNAFQDTPKFNIQDDFKTKETKEKYTEEQIAEKIKELMNNLKAKHLKNKSLFLSKDMKTKHQKFELSEEIDIVPEFSDDWSNYLTSPDIDSKERESMMKKFIEKTQDINILPANINHLNIAFYNLIARSSANACLYKCIENLAIGLKAYYIDAAILLFPVIIQSINMEEDYKPIFNCLLELHNCMGTNIFLNMVSSQLDKDDIYLKKNCITFLKHFLDNQEIKFYSNEQSFTCLQEIFTKLLNDEKEEINNLSVKLLEFRSEDAKLNFEKEKEKKVSSRIDISSKLSPILLEGLNNKDYKERMRFLNCIEKLLENAKYNISVKGINSLVNILKTKFEEPNKQLLKSFISFTGSLAVSVGYEFKPYAIVLMGPLIGNLSDKQPFIRKETILVLNKIANAIGFSTVFLFCCQSIQTDNSQKKMELLDWIISVQKQINDPKLLSIVIINCLQDKSSEIREKAETLLKFFLSQTKFGVEIFKKEIKELKPTIQKAINSILEKHYHCEKLTLSSFIKSEISNCKNSSISNSNTNTYQKKKKIQIDKENIDSENICSQQNLLSPISIRDFNDPNFPNFPNYRSPFKNDHSVSKDNMRISVSVVKTIKNSEFKALSMNERKKSFSINKIDKNAPWPVNEVKDPYYSRLKFMVSELFPPELTKGLFSSNTNKMIASIKEMADIIVSKIPKNSKYLEILPYIIWLLFGDLKNTLLIKQALELVELIIVSRKKYNSPRVIKEGFLMKLLVQKLSYSEVLVCEQKNIILRLFEVFNKKKMCSIICKQIINVCFNNKGILLDLLVSHIMKDDLQNIQIVHLREISKIISNPKFREIILGFLKQIYNIRKENTWKYLCRLSENDKNLIRGLKSEMQLKTSEMDNSLSRANYTFEMSDFNFNLNFNFNKNEMGTNEPIKNIKNINMNEYRKPEYQIGVDSTRTRGTCNDKIDKNEDKETKPMQCHIMINDSEFFEALKSLAEPCTSKYRPLIILFKYFSDSGQDLFDYLKDQQENILKYFSLNLKQFQLDKDNYYIDVLIILHKYISNKGIVMNANVNLNVNILFDFLDSLFRILSLKEFDILGYNKYNFNPLDVKYKIYKLCQRIISNVLKRFDFNKVFHSLIIIFEKSLSDKGDEDCDEDCDKNSDNGNHTTLNDYINDALYIILRRISSKKMNVPFILSTINEFVNANYQSFDNRDSKHKKSFEILKYAIIQIVKIMGEEAMEQFIIGVQGNQVQTQTNVNVKKWIKLAIKEIIGINIDEELYQKFHSNQEGRELKEKLSKLLNNILGCPDSPNIINIISQLIDLINENPYMTIESLTKYFNFSPSQRERIKNSYYSLKSMN